MSNKRSLWFVHSLFSSPFIIVQFFFKRIGVPIHPSFLLWVCPSPSISHQLVSFGFLWRWRNGNNRVCSSFPFYLLQLAFISFLWWILEHTFVVYIVCARVLCVPKRRRLDVGIFVPIHSILSAATLCVVSPCDLRWPWTLHVACDVIPWMHLMVGKRRPCSSW